MLGDKVARAIVFPAPVLHTVMHASAALSGTLGSGFYYFHGSSVEFNPLTDRVVRGHEGRFSRGPLPVFSAGGPCEYLWHGQECPLFDVVHPAFALPTTASSTPSYCPDGCFWRGCRGV